MAKSHAQEGLPVAVSTVGAFMATLLVLLAGTTNGTRPWILLMRAASAFLLVSGFLKLLTAGLIQVISWQRTAPKAPPRGDADPGAFGSEPASNGPADAHARSRNQCRFPS